MPRRREPDRSQLPPPELKQAELGQSKAFQDREKNGAPAVDYIMGQHEYGMHEAPTPEDRTPANDTQW